MTLRDLVARLRRNRPTPAPEQVPSDDDSTTAAADEMFVRMAQADYDHYAPRGRGR